MNHRPLGTTGVKVSALCYGTMPFGTEIDEAAAACLFHRCREAGINLFDCADVYGGGRAESILGRLIAPCRDEIVLTSKAYFPTGEDVNARGASRYHLVRAVEASLRRLGTDRIDLYYLHRFDDLLPIEETLRVLEDLVRQGKILYPAVSNFAAWQVARALGHGERLGFAPLVAMQPMYSLIKRQAEAEILPMAAAEGLAVFPYNVTAGGLLTGKYGPGRRPESGRLVSNQMYQMRYADPGYYEVAERFVALCGSWGQPPAAVAIAWVAAHPAVTSPIIGARTVEQLDVALAAADLALTSEQQAQLSALWPGPPPATDRNEERSAHNYGAR